MDLYSTKDSMKAQHWVGWRLTEKHLVDVKELDWLRANRKDLQMD